MFFLQMLTPKQKCQQIFILKLNIFDPNTQKSKFWQFFNTKTEKMLTWKPKNQILTLQPNFLRILTKILTQKKNVNKFLS